ncbi:MAG: extracellular solute-binding protein [Chloroflexota bacterium]
MTTINFSYISDILLEQTVQQFGEKNSHNIQTNRITWDDAWTDIVREAIYRNPMDVSEIGSSWISDLCAMDVLHPFSRDEISMLEAEGTFLPASWENCTNPFDCQVWSIPWTLDTRFLYYRRDLLEKAGVRAETAFVNDTAFKETLQALRDAGIPNPIVMPTQHTRMILHVSASWVWGNGGDFISPDARSALFGHAKVIEAFCQYYELGKFLSPEMRNLQAIDSDAVFTHGNAAITITGPWLLRNPATLPEVWENTEITFPPGVPFIGGTNLILWHQSVDPLASLGLIRFLTSDAFQRKHFRDSGYLPSRIKSLASPDFSNDSRFSLLAPRLQEGRSFKPLPLWGWVEERLCTTLRQIWEEFFLVSDPDIHHLVHKRLNDLERRLNLTLQQQV